MRTSSLLAWTMLNRVEVDAFVVVIYSEFSDELTQLSHGTFGHSRRVE